MHINIINLKYEICPTSWTNFNKIVPQKKLEVINVASTTKLSNFICCRHNLISSFFIKNYYYYYYYYYYL